VPFPERSHSESSSSEDRAGSTASYAREYCFQFLVTILGQYFNFYRILTTVCSDHFREQIVNNTELFHIRRAAGHTQRA
jgi:hypothetical protein